MSLVTSRYKTETRHHPLGKTCFHFYYHGLTCDEYDALRARANGHCEICGVAEEDTPRGALDVDHFQQGRVSFIRGMLCNRCNTGVMACVDGKKIWGSNRKWEAAARTYEANSWEKPSPEALELLAARVEMKPKYQPRQMPDRSRLNAIALPSRQGVGPMAERLLYYLTPEELAELVALLSAGIED